MNSSLSPGRAAVSHGCGILLLLFLFSANCHTLYAQASPGSIKRSAFISYGFGPCTTDLISTSPDADDPAGRSRSSQNFQLIRRADRIKATLGARFGMEFMIQSPRNEPSGPYEGVGVSAAYPQSKDGQGV